MLTYNLHTSVGGNICGTKPCHDPLSHLPAGGQWLEFLIFSHGQIGSHWTVSGLDSTTRGHSGHGSPGWQLYTIISLILVVVLNSAKQSTRHSAKGRYSQQCWSHLLFIFCSTRLVCFFCFGAVFQYFSRLGSFTMGFFKVFLFVVASAKSMTFTQVFGFDNCLLFCANSHIYHDICFCRKMRSFLKLFDVFCCTFHFTDIINMLFLAELFWFTRSSLVEFSSFNLFLFHLLFILYFLSLSCTFLVLWSTFLLSSLTRVTSQMYG